MTTRRPFGVLVAGALVLAPARVLPAEERLVRLTARESLHVVDAGAGRPVVLIPGLFGSAFGFRRVIPGLVARGQRAIVVEPLGVGGSTRPFEGDYSLTAQADRIAQVLGLLGVEKAVVVPHASAGSIALRLALRHPGRVAAIVSLEGGASETAATPDFRRAMRFAPLLKMSGGVRRIRSRVRRTLQQGSADPSWVTDEVVDGYVAGAAANLEATLAVYRGFARAREPEEIASRLGEIRCPVRLLSGAVPHEGGPSPEEIALLRGRLPSFSEETVAGAGHFLAEEAPASVVAAVGQAFVGMRGSALVRAHKGRK